MDSDKFELILVPSSHDPSVFSEEYQKELSEFSREANHSGQRAFAMDDISGGGGPIGEFIYNNPKELIAALTTICCVWLKSRSGRKLRLKDGDTEIEANTMKEVEEMVNHVKEMRDK